MHFSETSALTQALPTGIDFYHLGRIELEQTSAPERLDLATGHFGIGYRLEGEIRGGIVLCLGEGLDVSVYSEAGNIIASQLASALSAERQLEVSISPPRVLTSQQFRSLLASGIATLRTYIHRQGHPPGNEAVTLRVLLLPDFSEVTGNA
jgi:hypothetical protein